MKSFFLLVNIHFILLCITTPLFAFTQKNDITINPGQKPVTLVSHQVDVIDCFGRTKTISVPKKRIVVIAAGGVLSVIKALKAEDKVVGVIAPIRKLSSRYPIFSKLPIITDESLNPDYEAIFALHPDLIIASYLIDPDLEEKMEPEIQVIRLNAGPPLSYADDVKKLATVFERHLEAEDFTLWYQGQVDIINQRLRNQPAGEIPTVFEFYGGEFGTSDGPPFGTYGRDNFWVAPLIEKAGAVNISRHLSGDWIVVDGEWVITENPSVIVREAFSSVSGVQTIGYGANNVSMIKPVFDKMANNAALASTAATQNGRIFIIDGELIQTEWFLALHYLVKWFHPGRYSDLDPTAAHQEYLTRFQRIDYDLKKQGVFTYPRVINNRVFYNFLLKRTLTQGTRL